MTWARGLGHGSQSGPDPCGARACTERYWSTLLRGDPRHGDIAYIFPTKAVKVHQDWVDVLALGWTRRLRSSSVCLGDPMDRGGKAWCRWLLGRGGGGGGGRGAVVEVLQMQFIDEVVDVLMQLKLQQSRVFSGSSSTECWTRRPCDKQRQVRAVLRFESSCP